MFVARITTHAEIHEHDNVFLLYSPPLLLAANLGSPLAQEPNTRHFVQRNTHLTTAVHSIWDQTTDHLQQTAKETYVHGFQSVETCRTVLLSIDATHL